jgi:hypothetical protein
MVVSVYNRCDGCMMDLLQRVSQKSCKVLFFRKFFRTLIIIYKEVEVDYSADAH